MLVYVAKLNLLRDDFPDYRVAVAIGVHDLHALLDVVNFLSNKCSPVVCDRSSSQSIVLSENACHW